MDEQQAGAPIQPQAAPQSQQQTQAAVAAMPLPSASFLLGSAWKQYKAHAGLLISIFLVPVVVSLIISFVQGQKGGNALPGAVILVLALVNIIISMVGQIALFTAVSNPAQATFASSYSAGMKRFFPYLWLAIISSIILIGFTFLFVIPGIMFSILFSMGVLTFIVEDERGINALLKSKAYVEGRWWGVFGRLLFISIFVAILTLAVAAIAGGLLYVAGLAGSMVVLIVAVIAALLSLVLSPLSYVYIFGLYQSLKATSGVVTIDRSTGHKAKFVVTALVGLILIPFLIGASLLRFAANHGVDMQNLLQGSIKTPSSIYGDNPPLPTDTLNGYQLPADTQAPGSATPAPTTNVQ